MPRFDARQKSRKTTRLPATLAAELGIDTQSKPKRRPFQQQQRRKRNEDEDHDAAQPPKFKGKGKESEKPQLRVISRQPVASSSKVTLDAASRKRKSLSPAPQPSRTRINPITGQAENVTQPKRSKSSALEKLLNKAQAKPAHDQPRKKKRAKMSQTEKEEEDEIKWLEYHLASSKKPQDVRDDLDDFLDDLDRFQVGMFDESDEEGQEQDSESGSDDDDDDDDDQDESVEESESEQEDQDQDQGDDDISQGEVARRAAQAEWDAWQDPSELSFDDDDEQDFSNWDAALAASDQDTPESDDEGESESEGETGSEEQPESVSGTTPSANASSRDLSSAAKPAAPESLPAPAPPTTGRYIPPALRAKMVAEAAANSGSAPATDSPTLEQQKLRRQAQGLLNRMGDANIDTIVTEFEALYRSHSRAEVTSMITSILIDTISARSNLIDTYVILHASFVAAMHKVVGVEFAAFFVQRMVEELTKFYEQLGTSSASADEEEKGKECLNLTVLACELYNLSVVACPLIFDLIRLFLEKKEHGVIETDVELLLRIVRSCGSQLRHDDPASLKGIISLTHEKVNASGGTTTTRAKFMLERLDDLKNNRAAKADPSSPGVQLLTRMKKYLGGMGKKRTVRAYEPLRIGLKDLQDADKKGKWWLVGAAWAGHADQDDAEGLTKLAPMNARAPDADDQLLALARKQGMNTDARRSVFVTLLSAEDYRDAAHRVLGLKLNDVQRREIIRVLLHCVGSESTFNPYYVLIGHQVCSDSHSMKITLQYCLWDFLRELGEKEAGGRSIQVDEEGRELDPRRVANMARAYAWWMAKESLSLAALRTIDFTALRARGIEFLRQLVVHLLLSSQASSPASTLTTKANASFKTAKLEHVVRKGLAGNVDLANGLLVFLRTNLTPKHQLRVVATKKDKQDKLVAPLLECIDAGVKALDALVESAASLDPDVDLSD